MLLPADSRREQKVREAVMQEREGMKGGEERREGKRSARGTGVTTLTLSVPLMLHSLCFHSGQCARERLRISTTGHVIFSKCDRFQFFYLSMKV